jgi:hypothetical protein
LEDKCFLASAGLNLLGGTIWPNDFDKIGGRIFPESEGDDEFGLGEVTASGHDVAPMILAGDARADPGADGVAIGFGAVQLQADPIVLEGLVVAKEEWFGAGLGEDDVEITVAINI